MNRETDHNEFYEYIYKLEEIYEKNPGKATKEARDSLKRLSAPRKLLKPEEIKILLLALYYITIALVGLFNIKGYPMYIFGLAFFAAGSMVGLTQKGSGIVFLFSHGISGLVMMMAGMLANLFSSPIMSDNPTNIYIYIGIMISLAVIATIISLLHNLSDSLKERTFFIFIPLILFAVVILMGIILSKYVEYKFGITTTILMD